MNKLFGYPGGKWPIRHLIVSNFPEHITYVDVFGGSSAILVSKEPSKGEVFNDKNEEIVNFFRVVKHRPSELTERAKHWIHSRQLWYELKGMPPPEDEVERAFRFWALLADSFAGRGAYFGAARIGIRSVTHAREYLDAVAKRFKDIQVECLDFRKCIIKFDSQNTFFYLDPPYRNTKGANTLYSLLSDEDWEEMKSLLDTIQGKFLLSHTNDTFVLRLFKDYKVRKINVRVMLPRSKKAQTRKEVLISNYSLPVIRKKKHKIIYTKDKELHYIAGPRMVKESRIEYKVSVER